MFKLLISAIFILFFITFYEIIEPKTSILNPHLSFYYISFTVAVMLWCKRMFVCECMYDSVFECVCMGVYMLGGGGGVGWLRLDRAHKTFIAIYWKLIVRQFIS